MPAQYLDTVRHFINTSKVTGALIASVCFFSLLSLIVGKDALGMVPGETIAGSFQLYRIFTAAFIETNVVKFMLSVFGIFIIGSRIEAQSGNDKTLLFGVLPVVVAFLSYLELSFFSLIRYSFIGEDQILYDPRFGTFPLLVSLSVILIQLHGDSVFHSGILNSVVPVTILGVSFIFKLVNLEGHDFFVSCNALVLSWLYLRFIHLHQNVVGDSRESFEFLALLPIIARVPFRPVEKLCSKFVLPLFLSLLRMMGRVPTTSTVLPVSRSSTISTPTPVTPSTPGGSTMQTNLRIGKMLSNSVDTPSSSDPVYNHRKEAALMELNKRLEKLKAKNATHRIASSPSVAVPIPATPDASVP